MKRLILVIVLVLLFVPIVRSSVEAQPADDWTGFYAGLNIGYGWSDHAMQVSGDPLTEAFIDADVLPRALADDPSGVVGGAQVGYSHQIRWLVLGVEADFQGTDINAKESVSTAVPGAFPFRTTGEQELGFLGTLRGRIGIAPWRGLLFYGTGGLAYGDVRLSASVNNPGCLGVCASESRSGVETGWTVGAGVEYRFAPRWSVKTEYVHYDLGTESVELRDGRFPALEQRFRADFDGHVARVGVNFRF
jgi:outer membrane immunogenic protein